MKALIQKYGGIAVIVLAVVSGLVWGLWPDQERANRTATAPAEIIKAKSVTWTEGGSFFSKYSRSTTRSGYRVVYRFTANGQLASGVSEKNFWYKEGEQCRVCYEPGDPTNSDLRDATSGAPCGSKFFTR
jgi:hypothetical protein